MPPSPVREQAVAAARDIAVSGGEQESTLPGITQLIEAGVDRVARHASVMRSTSSSVVVPSSTFARPARRSVFMPSA